MKHILALTLLLGIFTLTPPPLGAEEAPHAEARRLFNALGCKGCHQFDGDGGSLAPSLDQIGSRMTREQIRAHLTAHADTRKTNFMPSYSTTSKEELELLSDFLYSHKK